MVGDSKSARSPIVVCLPAEKNGDKVELADRPNVGGRQAPFFRKFLGVDCSDEATLYMKMLFNISSMLLVTVFAGTDGSYR